MLEDAAMTFQALEISLEVVHSLRDPIRGIQRADRDLASQLRRAVNSVSLNLAEGWRREGRDRLHSFRVAAGSAAEAQTALRLASAWGYVAEGRLEQPISQLHRVLGILWSLTR